MNINGRRQGNLELISTDLSNATRILMVSKRPELMYDYLESKGDRYAKLANSVVKGDSLLGAFAMNHLDEFKLENGKKIENIEDKIRFKMAERYLVTLYSRFHNEGYSYFDPRFIENKKGCEANFRILPMRMSWPDLKPFSEVSHDVKMIEVYVEPLNSDPEKYFTHKKNIYLNMGRLKRKGELYYDEELELYFNEVSIEFKHINGNKVDVNIIKYGYYWDEDNGEVNVLMECSWRQLDDSYRLF